MRVSNELVKVRFPAQQLGPGRADVLEKAVQELIKRCEGLVRS